MFTSNSEVHTQEKSTFSDLKAIELINIAYEASSGEMCQIAGDYFNDKSIYSNLP